MVESLSIMVENPHYHPLSQFHSHDMSQCSIKTNGWLVSIIFWNFPFHLWDVIPTPLTNSIIFQDGEIAPPTSYQ